MSKKANRTLRSTVAATVILGALSATAADTASVDDRLKQIENQMQNLAKENSELKKELGYRGTNAPWVVPAGKESQLTIGGYIQANAEFGNSPDARFSDQNEFLVRKARLGIKGNFLEHFDFKVEGDFGNRDTSKVRSWLTDAYINYNQFSFANIKAGQFKVPYSYEELMPDTKVLFAERALPNEAFAPGRQIGAGVSGNFYEDRLGYSAGLFNGNGKNNQLNDDDNFMYAARVFGVPLKTKWGKQPVRWSLGIDGYYSDDKEGDVDTGMLGLPEDTFTGHRRALSADTQFQIGPFDLQAEYYLGGFSQQGYATQEAQGWYVQAEYYILPKKLQALVRYESLDSNTSISGTTSDTWEFGVNYYIKGTDLMIKLNYLLGNPAGGPDNQGRFVAQMQLVF